MMERIAVEKNNYFRYSKKLVYLLTKVSVVV